MPDLGVVNTVAALRKAVAAWRASGLSVGLVPTMGFLHRGHVALVNAARARTDRVIASIFVNPSQFGENEDFQTYPRDLDGDLAKLDGAGTALVFVPDVTEMYPHGFSSSVSVTGITDGLCGAARPGHFAGVATIVTKLLLQCLPDQAFFGEKDYQQLQVIRRMAYDLDIPVDIVGVATVREDDGLAISSRNAYLSPEHRALAPELHRAIMEAATAAAAGATAAAVCAAAEARLAATGFSPIDYVEMCDAETLEPVKVANRPTRVFAAAHLGATRLIDNVPVMGGTIAADSPGAKTK
jgi:pantoate--beta-alanine ligase